MKLKFHSAQIYKSRQGVDTAATQMHGACVFVEEESLCVGLPFSSEIVVIASRRQLDVGTFSYFQFQDPELQQLVLIPSILDFRLEP